ncbi:gamma-glutamyltransferase family protein [Megasphaera sueciensis]|uniref:gamma-glutamyltransferase family protein n=1 Tax=Megasphaera sueciensis TaxID=349094 RepID=UPI003D089C85
MKLDLDITNYAYPSRREIILGKKGMVCTSQSTAAQIGLDILRQGGNAVDAAIATGIAMTVLEPTSNGLGSDMFALVWMNNSLYGLNGSGYAPSGISRSVLNKRGVTKIPDRGWIPVTIPGAPAAWAELHRRFGRLSFKKLFEPTIQYAREGYAATPTLSQMWTKAATTFAPFYGKKEFSGLFQTFFPQGNHAPQIGEIITLKDHAKTLQLLAESNCTDFYHGEIADAIDAFSQKTGGYIRKEDLVAYKPEWVTPIHTNYRGYDVWEIPPNGHGLVALMALNIVSGYTFNRHNTADSLHHQIESMKLAFIDGKKYIADARFMKTDMAYWLSENYASHRRSLIGETAIMPTPSDPDCGGTIYLCTADGEGNMVSFIQSNFKGFGSGIVIPGYGIALNDRGNNFSMDENNDNCIMPLKKPYHTIIPGFLTKNGSAIGPFGVMGGFMQPQGHMQVIMNTIDFHMNPQSALDAPRWQWIGGKQIEMEPGFPDNIITVLREKGHDIIINPDLNAYGRGQIIWRNEEGVLMGGTEPRADGVVAAW